jgi:hypothetical protein
MINNDARSYASLSSGLLARKGAAKPAMRPQGFTGFDDLGWNDMGHAPAPDEGYETDLPEHVPSSISALTPAPKSRGEGTDVEEPEVVAQQRAIAESFPEEAEAEAEVEAEAEAEAEVEEMQAPPPAEVVRLPKRSALPVEPVRKASAIAGGRKAAFTLRLDADRHLRLRLATAVTGRSAQQIVTGALDALLDSIPEVEAMAARVPAKAKQS